MKNVKLFSAAFVMVCMFSMLTATGALALTFVLAEWLKNGAAITTNESFDIEGEGLLEDVLNGAAVLCSDLLEGTVGADGSGSVTKVFTLSGVEVKELDEPGATGGVTCTGIKICETGSEVWPVGLPVKVQLNLDTEDGKFYILGPITGIAADALLCLFLGSSIEELCETASNAFGEVLNGATDVEARGEVEPKGICNGNTEETRVAVDTGLGALLSGTLTVSG